MATNNCINTNTISTGGNVTFSGAFNVTFTFTNTTSVTFPTSGTLATTSQFVVWNDVSGTSQAAAVNNGYIISNASQTTVTLPATAAVGSVISVVGKGAAGWILTANTGQTIKLGIATTTSAGSLTSTNQYDCVEVICVTADTTWVARSLVGNLTVS